MVAGQVVDVLGACSMTRLPMDVLMQWQSSSGDEFCSISRQLFMTE